MVHCVHNGDWCTDPCCTLGTVNVPWRHFVVLRRLVAEADLGMFNMFGRTGAPTKRGPPQETWAGNNHVNDVIGKYSVNVG